MPLPASVLPFRKFLLRTRVLALYRKFFRETLGLERPQAIEIRA
jgi:hypothetical protein